MGIQSFKTVTHEFEPLRRANVNQRPVRIWRAWERANSARFFAGEFTVSPNATRAMVIAAHRKISSADEA